MGYFTDIEKAKVGSSHEYIKPGEYRLEVLGAKVARNPKNRNLYSAIEYKVLAAMPGSAHKVGEVVSHYIEHQGDYFLGDIKGAVAAIMAVDDKEITSAVAERFFEPAPAGQKQPGMGKTVDCIAKNKPTKKGTDFTKITYVNPAMLNG